MRHIIPFIYVFSFGGGAQYGGWGSVESREMVWGCVPLGPRLLRGSGGPVFPLLLGQECLVVTDPSLDLRGLFFFF